ncbi:MAG: large conductance mechanosensitive channel protein MscL [Tissierellia bacterium]|nr:large conductance mechanosensitive channel protein MscL [Tissierellia bacterium]
MFKEFKEFIQRGNVVDMAVGIIIGGAFGKIIASLVADILMPVIGLVMGGVDLATRFVSLDGNTYPTLEAAQEANAATLNYGLFIQSILDFLIIAFVIFLLVRKINAMKKQKADEAIATTKACSFCKTEIPIEAVKCPHCTADLN